MESKVQAVSQAALARLLGITLAEASTLGNRGVLIKSGGEFDLWKSIAGYVQHLRDQLKLANQEHIPESYPSMSAFAGAFGVKVGRVKVVKKSGCKAFDQANRVHLKPLVQFLLNDPTASDEETDWGDRLKRAQALAAELDLDEKRGELVKRSCVRADMDKASSRAIAVLVQKFESELPAKQDGLPATEIAEMNRTALREVREILASEELYAARNS